MASIKRKLMLSNILIALLSILFVSIPIELMQMRSLQEDLTEIAESKMSQGTAEIKEFLAEPASIVESFAQYIATHNLTYAETEGLLTQIVNSDDAFQLLYCSGTVPFSQGGTVIFGPPTELPSNFDQTTRPWYRDAQASQSTIYTEPYTDTVTGGLVMTLAKGSRTGGRFNGVAAIDISIDKINSIVSPLRLSGGGTSFLLNSQGLYLTNSDNSKVLKANFYDDYPQFAEHHANIGDTEAYVDINGKSGLYFASKCVSEEAGWILVTIGPQKELYGEIQSSINFVVVIVLVVTALSALIILLVARSIVRPIKKVDDAVNEIASGNADLTRRLEQTSNDEVGHLVAGFNKFVEKLQNIISDLKDSKNTLGSAEEDLQDKVSETASSITEILANIDSVDRQVQNQGNAVHQTSTAVEEIAENINSLERMIETQSSGVTQASAAVEEMIGNINSVNQSVEHMASSFEQLERHTEEEVQKQNELSQYVAQVAEQSRSLEDANKAIANVASQTNLLAMNAAIEAAHAGEAGKGFSVVADEIRKLSETSSGESKKIGEELKKIQETIGFIVESSQESSASIGKVNEQIQETDQLVRQIKSAMEEQQEGSKQIVDSLKMMNDSTIEVKSASKEMAEGNKVILSEIQNLQNTTNVIKGSMEEMTIGAQHINQTGSDLSEISGLVDESVKQIGNEIDQFKA